MSLHPVTQSFRRAKFGSAAVLAITAAIVQFPSAASALELSEVTSQTDCRAEAIKRIENHVKPFVIGWDAKCSVRKLDIAKKEGQAEDQVGACITQLVKFRTSNPGAFTDLLKQTGKITRENACPAAARIPQKPVAGLVPKAG